MKEIWKTYKEFDRPWNAKNPKHYIIEVSNYGNVKRNGEIIIPKINGGGYRYCHSFKVARAVAELFIPNPENKPAVDHIDTNKLNDNVTNLQWVTNTENMNNPLTRKHLSESKMGHTYQRGEKNSMYGKHHSEEARKKQSEARKRYLLNKSNIL